MSNAISVSEKIIRALSKFYDESSRVRISSAHLSGVSYENIGEDGLDFLEDLSKDGKFSTYTTANPMGADIYSNDFGLDDTFIIKQRKIADALLRLGAQESFTCTPYDYFHVPPPYSHVAWAESSAVVYGNAFLGLLTNKESSLSALASAILGETIQSDLHYEKNRIPEVGYKIDELKNEVEAGLAAYYIAKLTKKPFSITINAEMTTLMKKSFSAALGAIGETVIFSVNKPTTENHEIRARDLMVEFKELSTEDSGDIIVLGCPHFNHNEIEDIVSGLGEKHFKKDCLVACYKGACQKTIDKYGIYALAKKKIVFFRGACPIFSPLIKDKGIESVITSSVKAAHYYRLRGIKVALKTINEIIKSEAE
jgi:hypothetical protein